MAFFAAILFGVLEGITEWLPVSSTGHLILLSEVLTLSVGESVGEGFSEAFRELFDVLIQLAAIFAVLWRFFSRLNPFSRQKSLEEKKATWRLYGFILLSGIPAMLVAFGLDPLLTRLTGRDLDGWLYRSEIVAAALILYGIVFLTVDRKRDVAGKPLTAIRALNVGCFQALAVIPGTSRSGATILGGLLSGLDRKTAAEYSFFLAVPTMLGAGAIRMLSFFSFLTEKGYAMPQEGYAVLLLGMATSFIVSLLSIDFLMDFVKRSTLRAFGVYRIVLGIAVWILLLSTR